MSESRAMRESIFRRKHIGKSKCGNTHKVSVSARPYFARASALFLMIAMLLPVTAFAQTTKGETVKSPDTTTPPKKTTPKKTTPAKKTPANTNSAAEDERVFWESIRDSKNPADFRAYLKKYPNGKYADLAQNRLDEIEAERKQTEANNSRNNTNTTPTTTSGNSSPAKSFRNRYGMELVYIPAGEFMMGSSDAEAQSAYQEAKRYVESASLDWFKGEKPKHRVIIKEGFHMGRYEVTQAQYQQVMGVNPSNFKSCDSCPVEQVSWNDAKEFIKKLNAMNDGFTYRLPSEAEWEYACRAGTTTAFSFGDSLSSTQANFNGDYPYGSASKGEYKGKTTPVGSYQPNAFGLYDMHGNVWEWVEDIYAESYDGLPTDGSANVSKGDSSVRVLRGGSWYGGGRVLRSAVRLGFFSPSYRDADDFGFRVVASPRTQ